MQMTLHMKILDITIKENKIFLGRLQNNSILTEFIVSNKTKYGQPKNKMESVKPLQTLYF